LVLKNPENPPVTGPAAGWPAHVNGFDGAPEDLHVPGIRGDKDGLPVLFDAASNEKQPDTDTSAISLLWHELISPLSVIKGYASTLLQLDDAITDDQKEQYLRGIDSASNRVIRLLENLRDITRLEETGTINLLRISLIDLLQLAASEIQHQTKRHTIKVIPSSHLPLVSADPEKIELVINNLLANAIKYSPDGGDIEIAVKAVRNGSELRSLFGDAPSLKTPCLLVSVADEGVGIPESEVEKIFEKFYRIKNKLTRVTPGAGLGLYISKTVVEAHGGRIWAGNRPQGGSLFCFSLPLDRPLKVAPG
jgi:signal transduction histidine kinase